MSSPNRSSPIVLFMIVLCLGVAPLSKPVGAADEWLGGQVCQPMNLDIALKGLQWRSEGALNNSSDELWVVCPVGQSIYYSRIDVAVFLTNFGNSGATIQCLWKVTDTGGHTVRSRNKSKFIGAGASNTMYVENLSVGSSLPESISVSCKLPPKTGILLIGSESY